MRRYDLRSKFITLIVFSLLLIFSLISLVVIKTYTDGLRSSLLNNARSFAALATEPIAKNYITYQDSGTVKIKDSAKRFSDLNSIISNVAIVDVQGNIKFTQNDRSIVLTQSQAETFKPIYIYDTQGVLKRIIQPYIEEDGVHRFNLVYDVSNSEIQNSITSVVWTILFFITIGLIISVVFTYYLVNRFFLRPVKQLSKQAQAISKGETSQEIHIDRNDEIGDLAKSVNAMAQSLKQDIQKLEETDKLKTEFMIIASHNLRTPLTVINGYLDELGDLKTVDDYKQAMSKISSSAAQLNAFAEDILVISSIEAGEQVLHFSKIEIKPLLNEIVSAFKPFTEEKKLDFEVNIDIDDEVIEASRTHLRSAVWNLLDNAVKFSDQGSKIELRARIIESSKLIIDVIDSGIGISDEEIPKLFTKFHRGTSFFPYQYEGTGIGLYVTKLIVGEHKGEIEVKSKLKEGSTFTIILPLAVDPVVKEQATGKATNF